MTATNNARMQEERGNRLIARRRCRIEIDRSMSGEMSSPLINNDRSHPIIESNENAEEKLGSEFPGNILLILLLDYY